MVDLRDGDTTAGSSSANHEINNDDNRGAKRTDVANPKKNKKEALNTPEMKRAEQFRRNLPRNTPSCAMLMQKSNVLRGFMIQFPAWFYRDHLPDKNSEFVLVALNKDGEEQHTETVGYLYNTSSVGKLSAKWREFSTKLGLGEGDVLFFQRRPDIRRSNDEPQVLLHVYIFRKSQLTEVHGDVPMDTEEQELLLLDSDKPSHVDPGSNGDLKGKDVSEFTVTMGEAKKAYDSLGKQQLDGLFDMPFMSSDNVDMVAGMISETDSVADEMDKLQKWNEAQKLLKRDDNTEKQQMDGMLDIFFTSSDNVDNGSRVDIRNREDCCCCQQSEIGYIY